MNHKNEDISIMSWIVIKFKRWHLKRKINWKRFKNKHFKPAPIILSIDKQKMVDLFIVLLKNKYSNLNHSPESKTRFIESEFAWASLHSARDDRNYVINIIDETVESQPHSHEILIPEGSAIKIMDIFDEELEKRFRALEIQKKQILVSDLNKLMLKIMEEK